MKLFSHLGVVALLAGIATPVFAQRPPAPSRRPAAAEQRMTLVVNNRSAPDAVVRIDGRSYVDLESLARITNASVSYQPDRVVLRLPSAEGEQAPQATPTPEAAEGLSRRFVTSAIAELAKARAWKEAVAVVIQLGVPAGSWPNQYRGQTEESLMQASVAATTPDDMKAMQLLQNNFRDLEQWDDNTAAMRANMIANQSIDPNALGNDSLLARISDCQEFLSTMLVNGEFADHPSCR